MARPEGLEPPAYWFEANRSIQLSYGRGSGDRDLMVSPPGAPASLRGGARLLHRLFRRSRLTQPFCAGPIQPHFVTVGIVQVCVRPAPGHGLGQLRDLDAFGLQV